MIREGAGRPGTEKGDGADRLGGTDRGRGPGIGVAEAATPRGTTEATRTDSTETVSFRTSLYM